MFVWALIKAFVCLMHSNSEFHLSLPGVGRHLCCPTATHRSCGNWVRIRFFCTSACANNKAKRCWPWIDAMLTVDSMCVVFFSVFFREATWSALVSWRSIRRRLSMNSSRKWSVFITKPCNVQVVFAQARAHGVFKQFFKCQQNNIKCVMFN